MSGTDFPGGHRMQDRWPKPANPKAGPGAGDTQRSDRTAAGAGTPPVHFPKAASGETKRALTAHNKLEDSEMLQFGHPSTIGTAPTSRIYTRDYTKVGRDKDQTDLVSSQLGNPLGL